MTIPPHLDDPNPYRDADPYDDGRDLFIRESHPHRLDLCRTDY
jgi:hypothetical protein